MDLDTLLHETRDVPAPSNHTIDRAHSALLLAARDAGLRVKAVRRSRQRRGRRAGVLVLAGAAAAAVLLGPTVGLRDDAPPDSAAADVLREAAVAAGARGDDWSEAPYWHSVSESSVVGSEAYRRESWQSRSGPGVVVDERPRDLGGYDGIFGIPEHRYYLGDESLTWEDLAALPTDPESVRELLLAGLNPDSSRSEADQLFGAVMDLLAESPLPADFRQALWEIAAQQPGVTAAGGQTDAVGRPGVLLTLDSGEHPGREGWSYLVDPDEGRLLEVRVPATTWPALDEHGNPTDGEPTTTPPGRTTYLESGPADTAPEPPPDPCGNEYRGC